MVDTLSSAEQKEVEALSFILKKRIQGWYYQPGILVVQQEDDSAPLIIRQREPQFIGTLHDPESLEQRASYYEKLAQELVSIKGKRYICVDHNRTIYESAYKQDTTFNRLTGRQSIISPEIWSVKEVKPIEHRHIEINDVTSLYLEEHKMPSIWVIRNPSITPVRRQEDATLDDLRYFMSILPEPPIKSDI